MIRAAGRRWQSLPASASIRAYRGSGQSLAESLQSSSPAATATAPLDGPQSIEDPGVTDQRRQQLLHTVLPDACKSRLALLPGWRGCVTHLPLHTVVDRVDWAGMTAELACRLDCGRRGPRITCCSSHSSNSTRPGR